jgi:hypothetical protein
MGTTISLKRAQQLLDFSIEDDFHVTGAIRFFGRLPKSFLYRADQVYFRSLDGEYFIKFYLHPKKKRIFTAESSTGVKIDLYFYNPSFEFAVHKAKTAGKERILKNGGKAGWGKHVLAAWDVFQRDFSEHGIIFTEESMRKILDEVLKRRIY